MQGRELRIGVIGTGAIGRAHTQRINTKLEGGKVVACADPSADYAKQASDEHRLQWFATGEELIASSQVDAVIITTVDEFHDSLAIAAIQAGKPVFVEKPLSPTSEGCKRVLEAEMKGGKQLVQVGFMRRYDPGYRQIKGILDKRTYGEPLMLHCAHRNFDCPDYYNTPMAVENTAIHEIDVLRWLLNEDYATAEVVFPRKTKHASEILEDPQILYLTTQSGVRIDVEIFVNTRYGYDIKCEVVCEEGVVNLPEPANAMIRTNASRVTPICRDWSERFPEAYDIELQDWINASKQGKVNGPTAWDGYVGAVTATAASKARDTGTVVKIELDECPEFYKK